MHAYTFCCVEGTYACAYTARSVDIFNAAIARKHEVVSVETLSQGARKGALPGENGHLLPRKAPESHTENVTWNSEVLFGNGMYGRSLSVEDGLGGFEIMLELMSVFQLYGTENNEALW